MHSQHPAMASRWDKEQKASGKPFPHADLDVQQTTAPMAGGTNSTAADMDITGRPGHMHTTVNKFRPEHEKGYHLSGGRSPIDGAAESMDPHIYRYKSPHDEPRSQPNGGIYAGIFAQHLQKDPIAGQAIQQTPGGLKVELGPQVSTLSAIAGRHNQRLGAHEMHVGGLLRAHHHMKQQIDQHAQMLEHLHNILSRKLTP